MKYFFTDKPPTSTSSPVCMLSEDPEQDEGVSFDRLDFFVEAWKNNPRVLAEMNEELEHLTVAE